MRIKIRPGKFAAHILLFGLTLSTGPALRAQDVAISVEIEYLVQNVGDTNASAWATPKTNHVRCVVGATNWSIEVDAARKQSASFDGTRVSLRSSSFARPNISPSTNGFPLGDFAINLPWLAFCSGHYLAQSDRQVALPCNDLRHCPDRYAYTDRTATFDEPDGLPRKILLLTSRSNFLASHTQWDVEQKFGDRYVAWKERTVLKLQEGLVMFQYSVLEATNLFGRSYPLRFEFFQGGRPYEEDADWTFLGTGRVTAIGPAAKSKPGS